MPGNTAAQSTAWEELEKLVEEEIAGGAMAEALGDAVHDAASSDASNTNNAGVAAQLEFLRVRGWSPEDVLKAVGPEKPEEAEEPDGLDDADLFAETLGPEGKP